jgi:putative membrane protein
MKTSMSLPLGLLAAVALAGCASHRATMGAGPAVIATTTTTTATVPAPAPATRLSAADLQFVAVAAGSGMYEVDVSRVAISRASDPQVKAYAQMLLDHHTANNGELIALVNAKGHRVAPGLPPSLQQKVTTLSGLSGPAFDREFVRTSGVQDHRATIAAFEQGRTMVADRDLRAYIDKTLPVLRSHLQNAQDLAGRMAG